MNNVLLIDDREDFSTQFIEHARSKAIQVAPKKSFEGLKEVLPKKIFLDLMRYPKTIFSAIAGDLLHHLPACLQNQMRKKNRKLLVLMMSKLIKLKILNLGISNITVQPMAGKQKTLWKKCSPMWAVMAHINRHLYWKG